MRLLLHVVEEMTSLSRIIRSIYTESNGDNVKTIKIRDMFEIPEIEGKKHHYRNKLRLKKFLKSETVY